MDKLLAEEIIACLSNERTLYPYFPGRYALLLLAQDAGIGTPISHLRRGRFSALLQKPIVKDVLAKRGDGLISEQELHSYWSDVLYREFVLGLTIWGDPKDRRWSQTSRKGYNIVLQLNLNTGDMDKLARLTKFPKDFNYSFHPSCSYKQRRYRETVAWARMDVNFATDEVLIEEVQSDFVREAQWQAQQEADPRPLANFCKPLRRVWCEAMLAATIQFIWQELGIQRIFYHDFETGTALKGIGRSQPPKSIYTTLPRQFCMQPTSEPPQFLQQDSFARRALKKINNHKFYSLTAKEASCQND